MATDSSFLTNWNTLPAELKTYVLEYALPSEEVFSKEDFARGSWKGSAQKDRFTAEVLPLYACSEIATLAIKIFYRQNIMFFFVPDLAPECGAGIQVLETVHMPPRNVRQHVKRLYLKMVLSPEYMDYMGIGLLRMISAANYGWGTLKSVNLHIYTSGSNRSSSPWVEKVLESYRGVRRIKIPTQLLEVHYSHQYIVDRPTFALGIDILEMPILGIFTIVGGATETHECFERYKCYLLKNVKVGAKKMAVKELVQDWPTLTEEPASRTTVKRVWSKGTKDPRKSDARKAN